MNQESILGMVLSAAPVGEYDKRLVILTREKGKIAAFARGARRPGSALLASSQPFTFGTFHVYRGKDAYSVAGVDAINYFEELRFNLDAVYYGVYFCEFAGFVSRENMDASDILKLLYQSLRALIKKTIPFSLIRYIFEFKMMVLNGQSPQVFACACCSDKAAGRGFSVKAGGLVCASCAGKYDDIRFLGEAGVYTLQFIVATPVEKLYTFLVNNDVLEDLRALSSRYLAFYLNHTFQAAAFLKKQD